MAFDGFVISNLVYDMKSKLIGGRITKISQPEKDEIILTIKNYNNFKLDISVSASLPLMYFTEETKAAPLTAPGFCMLLRKHLNSARILDVIQPDMERVIQIKIEHLDEMGDLKIKWLMIEIMGKHSNIIFTDDNMKIVDSIKHISLMVSSVREVLPGRDYFIPKTTDKVDLRAVSKDTFVSTIRSKNGSISKGIYSSYTGFSPLIANEICFRSGIAPDANIEEVTDNELEGAYAIGEMLLDKANKGEFSPVIILKDDLPIEFSCFELKLYDSPEYTTVKYESISQVLSEYYSLKDKVSRIRTKSALLRKTVSNAIERVSHKYDLQQKQIESTMKRDKYKIYGELITTYGYSVEEGSKSMTCLNYYDNQEITIPLDATIPVMANAKKYFDRYAKLKRTNEAATEQLAQSKEELDHLLSIQNSLDIALQESDLVEIRRELADFGYIKKSGFSKDKKDKRMSKKSAPLHYLTPEGFHIYVGKNNYQNDELTFKVANGNDWWFHAKKAPGSHVILKTEGKEVPDSVFEYAASLAAFYSSLKDSQKVEIDYLQRKNVKKPNAGKPGFVVYYTNYSMIAGTDISKLTLVNE
jgi:predicted ribosome quality control (RQC) complex YloA/Tae2 family protein